MTRTLYALRMAREDPPRYRQISDDLRARMESGEYPPDSRLPSKTEMMKRYGVALATVNRAVDELRKLGLVETVHGVGTFARKPPVAQPGTPDGYSRLAAEVAEMAEALGRVEGNLVELYGKTGNDYPWEDLPDRVQPAGEKDGSHEQRA
jgi:GntR family transcriptional regulator